MPAIIPRHLEGRWLDPTNKNLPELESILKPYPDDQIVCHRVSIQVNGTAIDGRQLIAPIDPVQEQADEEAHSLAAKEIARQLKDAGKDKQATKSKPKEEQRQESGQLSLFDQFPQ
jgi:hypothetical protein